MAKSRSRRREEAEKNFEALLVDYISKRRAQHLEKYGTDKVPENTVEAIVPIDLGPLDDEWIVECVHPDCEEHFHTWKSQMLTVGATFVVDQTMDQVMLSNGWSMLCPLALSGDPAAQAALALLPADPRLSTPALCPEHSKYNKSAEAMLKEMQMLEQAEYDARRATGPDRKKS